MTSGGARRKFVITECTDLDEVVTRLVAIHSYACEQCGDGHREDIFHCNKCHTSTCRECHLAGVKTVPANLSTFTYSCPQCYSRCDMTWVW